MVLTETPGNPFDSHFKMTEMLFEAFEVPALYYGTDALFSYYYNRAKKRNEKKPSNEKTPTTTPRTVVVSCGHRSTHIYDATREIPWRRIPVGGYDCTSYLQSRLLCKTPHFKSTLTRPWIDTCRARCCFVATDLRKQLAAIQRHDVVSAADHVRSARCVDLDHATEHEDVPVVVQLPYRMPEHVNSAVVRKRKESLGGGTRIGQVIREQRMENARVLTEELQRLMELRASIASVERSEDRCDRENNDDDDDASFRDMLCGDLDGEDVVCSHANGIVGDDNDNKVARMSRRQQVQSVLRLWGFESARELDQACTSLRESLRELAPSPVEFLGSTTTSANKAATAADDKDGDVVPPARFVLERHVRDVVAEHHQIRFGSERVLAAEVLFDPRLIGVESHMGLGEALETIVTTTPATDVRLFLCGGMSHQRYMSHRVLNEVRQILPIDVSVDVWTETSEDGLDAWRGACLYAREHHDTRAFRDACLTRAQYLEAGEQYVMKMRAHNALSSVLG